MERKHFAIENPEDVCFKCLKETKVNKIRIVALGYGSSFDNFSTRINLCDDCMSQTDSEWWKLELVDDEWGGHYKYESEIFNFVKTLPVEGRELFYARYGDGACADHMLGQDWIDYELDILPHEKCKIYGCASPQEVQAYKDRFPICKHVEIKVYSDGSKESRCFRNALGDGEGNCRHYSNKCYLCNYFEERDGEIKVIDMLEDFYERETERLHDMIKYDTERLEKINNKTLKTW